jgi:hypothetical protein
MPTKITAKVHDESGTSGEVTLERVNEKVEILKEVVNDHLWINVTNGGEKKEMYLADIIKEVWLVTEPLRDFLVVYKKIKKYKKPIAFILLCIGLYFGWGWIWHLLKL